MMRTAITFILLSSLIYSCDRKSDVKIKNSNRKVLYNYVPTSGYLVDSVEFFTKVNEFEITTAKEVPYSIWSNDNDKKLNAEILMLELEYWAYACTCPQWHISKPGDYKASLESKEAIYIEAFDSTIDLESKFSYLMYDGNRFVLLGRFYNDIGFPKNFVTQTPDPPEARVFKYYSFRILDPYMVYAQKVKVHDDQESDSITIRIKCVRDIRTVNYTSLK